MEHKQLIYKSSQISYYRFGTGPKPVICFHGYGEEALSFSFLEHNAGEQFTFYSIDLPFHGKTVWKEGLNFTNNDLLKIVQNIRETDNLKLKTQNLKPLLLGFSLGGPGRLEKEFLVLVIYPYSSG